MTNGNSRTHNFTKFLRKHILVLFMMLSIFLGVGLGCVIRTSWSFKDKRNIFYLKFPGEIMLNTLQMVSVPLVVSSIISSLASLSMKTSGSIGLKALLYYLVTTVCGVVTGTVAIVIISTAKEPLQETGSTTKGSSQLDSLLDMISLIFTDVPIIRTISGTNMLGLIVASIFIGCILSSMQDNAKPLVDFFQSLYQTMMKLILIFIWFTPVGLTFLVAAAVVQVERPLEALKEFAVFISAVIFCFLLHGFGTVPILYFIVTRKNPYIFLRNMSKALLTAFGSTSSAAALPFTMDCLIRKNKVDKRVVNFIAPIGATINMDGVALYIPMMIIFIFHRLGFALDPTQYIIIGLSAIGVSVGAAGIPGAGLMYMSVAAVAVGLPPDEVLITAPFDWIFAQFRTMINVSGDSFGAGIIDHLSSSMPSNVQDREIMTHNGEGVSQEDEETDLV